MATGPFTAIKRARYFSEFLGTFFLVLTIKLAASNLSSTFAGLAIGSVLMIVIYNFGWISGAHFNPAVTTALVVRGNLPSFPRSDRAQIILYYVSQFLGGICGGCASALLSGELACQVAPYIGDGDNDVLNAFFCEFFFTFLLCGSVINTGTLQDGNQYYGITIGMSLFVSVISIGNISGSCINPAVWLGLTVSAAICDNEDVQFEYIWLYLLAEILGAIVVGCCYLYIILPGMEQAKMDDGRTDNVTEMKHVNQSSTAVE